jgi:transcriptional regulator with XRE-family HTH domain
MTLPAKRRYASWGEFLKKKRETYFRSAREFCNRLSLGISYPQYSRYEAGDQLPSLEQALELCRILSVSPLEGLLHWNRAQLAEDPDTLKEVDQLLVRIRDEKPAGKAEVPAKAMGGATGGMTPLPLDNVLVFNRSHLKLFLSDPGYRDVFTYINSYAPEWVALEEIALSLNLTVPKTRSMVDSLADAGVLMIAEGKARASKKIFYYPDDSDFFPLRNVNLSHNAQSIMKRLKYEDLQHRRGYRGLLTRELTFKQLDWVIQRLEELTREVVALPETEQPDKIFSMCLLLGERFSRPARADLERFMAKPASTPMGDRPQRPELQL